MKRDMDLIRDILLEVESIGPRQVLDLAMDDWDPFLANDHARLLSDSGFLKATFTMGSPPGAHITGLTWAGHDLLDSIRDDSVWAAVKKRLGEVGGSASIDVLKALATQVIKVKLGLPEG